MSISIHIYSSLSLSRARQALTTVRLGGCALGAAGAEFLAHMLRKNRTLTALEIPYNDIGELGAAAFGEVTLTLACEIKKSASIRLPIFPI